MNNNEGTFNMCWNLINNKPIYPFITHARSLVHSSAITFWRRCAGTPFANTPTH